MNKKILNIILFTVIAYALINCKNKPKEDEMNQEKSISLIEGVSETYMVNTKNSVIEWKGFKPTGSNHGTVNIEKGFFEVSNGLTINGSFLIDMNSIKESEDNTKLENHLKNPDFFDVENFPFAKFEITGSTINDDQTYLSGNLTIKDITNAISIPVNLSSEDTIFTITSNIFNIDRSRWDIKFQSKSFFSDLGDKFINDEIEMKINISASK